MLQFRSCLLIFVLLLTWGISSCACKDVPESSPSIAQIQQRGTLLVGTTGDYRPLSFREPSTGQYWGFDLEIAQKIAERLGVSVEYRATSWPTLTEDTLNTNLYDLAIGGITITEARKAKMSMSDGYLTNGKTILCRAKDRKKYRSLDDLNKASVKVMVNPGGLNEKFARENLPKAQIIVYPKNEEIPAQIAQGKADVMITEITEAPYYTKTNSKLAAPLLNMPFNHGEIGVLMRKEQGDLLDCVNTVIGEMKADGSLKKLHEKYGLRYGY